MRMSRSSNPESESSRSRASSPNLREQRQCEKALRTSVTNLWIEERSELLNHKGRKRGTRDGDWNVMRRTAEKRKAGGYIVLIVS
jgi:hypothetical protein